MGAPVSLKEIFIVDDDLGARDSLSAMFTHAGYEATTFSEGRSFLRAAQSRVPTCILLGISMPGPSGLDMLTELDAKHYLAPIIMLSAQSDIPSVIRAIRNGAFDFIDKKLNCDEIVARVGAVVELWARDRQFGWASQSLPSIFPGYELLTSWEREVLFQITAAASNKETARVLGISPRTVEIHRGHIMQKLRAKNSVDLIRIVLNK